MHNENQLIRDRAAFLLEKTTLLEEDSVVLEGMVCLRALFEKQGDPLYTRRIKALLYDEKRLEKHRKEYAFLCHRAREFSFPLYLCTKKEINGLATGTSHGGVIALCTPRPLPDLTAQLIEKEGFYVMMEGIEDPFNFGYALRSLYAAGVNGVILSSGSRTGADGIIARSSAGASELLSLFLCTPQKAVDLFKDAGYALICADLPNSLPVYDVCLKKPLLLVVGGEKRGISAAVLKKSDAIVRLDYGRPFDAALSAASAASILAFEVYRQNRKT